MQVLVCLFYHFLCKFLCISEKKIEGVMRCARQDGGLEEKSNLHFLQIPNSDRPVGFYS